MGHAGFASSVPPAVQGKGDEQIASLLLCFEVCQQGRDEDSRQVLGSRLQNGHGVSPAPLREATTSHVNSHSQKCHVPF